MHYVEAIDLAIDSLDNDIERLRMHISEPTSEVQRFLLDNAIHHMIRAREQLAKVTKRRERWEGSTQ